MAKRLELGFPHRHNANGTHDSICTKCFVTVATAKNEPELEGHESAHVCNPVDVSRFSRGASVPYEARAATFS
jgi:hypothetical protein